jgi:hypothetical protein
LVRAQSRHVPSARPVARLAVAVVAVALLGACGTGKEQGASAAGNKATVETTIPVPTTPTTPPGPPMTSCKTVVHLGDSTSIGLFSPAYLPTPAERIDAQYARVGVTKTDNQVSGARSIVEHLKGQLNAEDVAKNVRAAGYRGCWVFALGTTDAADIAHGSTHTEQDRIDRMMVAVSDDPVLWVNVKTIKTTGDWANANMVKFDQVLGSNQDKYPNLHIYDWSAVVQDAWFTSDDIHYTSAGSAQRAKLIADALAVEIPAGN